MSRSLLARTAQAAGIALILTAAASPAMADPSKANIVITGGNSGGAPGSSRASGTYRLTARVPTACWVRPTGTVLAGSGLAGSVVEACNNPGGFTISASYRPLSGTEKAKLRYADRLIDLSKSGHQELRRSSMATIRTVNYQFDEVELDEPLILSLTIQPI